jgi:hypothetical protein
MTHTTYTCDRCRGPVLTGRTAIVIECGPLRARGTSTLDLCVGCSTALVAFLGGDDPPFNVLIPETPRPMGRSA